MFVNQTQVRADLTGVEWIHCLFLFPLVLGKNVVVTCKTGSFLCSLNNLFQKKSNIFFFGNQILNGAYLKKELFLTYFSHYLLLGRSYKNSFSTYLTHIYMYFAHPIDFFCHTNFEKKNTNLSGMVSLWCDS